MIFDYNNPNNLAMLVDVAQLLHVLYVVLFATFMFHLSKNYKKITSVDKKITVCAFVVLFVGLGAIMNGVAVSAVSLLNR